MSKKRYIDTKFWNDNWVMDKLNPLDRYLFLYLLTNSKTNVAGVYEISLRTVSFETGIDREELTRMLANLEPKVIYVNNWIVLRNTIRHQNYTNQNVGAGIRDALKHCPPELLEYIELPEDFQVEVVPAEKRKSRGYKVTASKRFKILRRDKYTCQYCGEKAPDVVLHVDHRTPISKGGTNDDENLVTACDGCNLGKYDSNALEDPLGSSKTLQDPSRPLNAIEDSSSNIDFDFDFDFDSDFDLNNKQHIAQENLPSKKSTQQAHEDDSTSIANTFEALKAIIQPTAKGGAATTKLLEKALKRVSHDELVTAARSFAAMYQRDTWRDLQYKTVQQFLSSDKDRVFRYESHLERSQEQADMPTKAVRKFGGTA